MSRSEGAQAGKANVKELTGNRSYAKFLRIEGEASVVIDEAKIDPDLPVPCLR